MPAQWQNPPGRDCGEVNPPKLLGSGGWEERPERERGSLPGQRLASGPRVGQGGVLLPTLSSPPAFWVPPLPLPLPPAPFPLLPPAQLLFHLHSRALLTKPELTLGSRTRSGGPLRPGRRCGWVPERETKLKLMVLQQLPSPARDTDLHGLRPRLLPYPSLDLFLGRGTSTPGRGAPPAGPGARWASPSWPVRSRSGSVQPVKGVCRTHAEERPEDTSSEGRN